MAHGSRSRYQAKLYCVLRRNFTHQNNYSDMSVDADSLAVNETLEFQLPVLALYFFVITFERWLEESKE
jgi:hypothetical protein